MQFSSLLLLACTRLAVCDEVVQTNLEKFIALARDFPEAALEEIRASPLRAVVREVALPEAAAPAGSVLPTVTAHGMGDSCFEPGFMSVTHAIGRKTGSYARCIPTGGNIATDTIDGFLMTMDKSVDVFAEKIRKDPKLQGGFNAIGFSQGNSLIRGYIQKYNDPPVNAFISVHGTVMGVSAFPSCFSQGKPVGLVCKALAETLSTFADTGLVQGILFQADYFRDPTKEASKGYLSNSEIAKWNNENPASVNKTYAENFGKVKRFAMVKAAQDSMVYPNDGEWWGSLPDGTYGSPLPMKETKFYKDDLFGLKTADGLGKISFESTPGDHLQFSDKDLYSWVEKYFMGQNSTQSSVIV
mmetsp:Transcript_155647/g.290505  ORF Transcript_155647/g.290505 Transcript_155647/m.290505 type:complete len:357 (+) Transcript_155647:63-1133(+)